MFSRDEMQRAIEDALKTMEGVALELYRRGREEAREELEEARARNADMRAMLEQVTRERDEALARCETLRELADAAAYEQGLAQRRMMDAQRERDEARAEVERLRTEVASSLAMASAEADVLRGFGCMEDGDGPCGVCRECFYRHGYRRGAEAMRERCEELVKHNSHEDGIGMGSQRIESAIRALSIPEEP